jgi:N-acetylmuramoyl-L-alanine amidase
MKKIILLILFIALSVTNIISSEGKKYLSIKAREGQTLSGIFELYEIPYNTQTIKKFQELNPRKVGKSLKILWGLRYKLPIEILPNNKFKQQFSTELDSSTLQDILTYNKRMEAKKLKTTKKEIWIPTYFPIPKTEYKLSNDISIETKSKNKKETKNNKLFEPYFGKKYQKIKIHDNALKGCVFYLVSGHGGIDPGAIGKFDGNELHEDEYAYDITLRLALELHKHRAKVYMITIDTNDGIRDDKFLKPSYDEIFYGGIQIPTNQKERLQECANIVNKLYQQNKKRYKSHISVNIHLDSRSEGEKIDVFFYYQESNAASKAVADSLLSTLRLQYEKFQPGRGYSGTVDTRNLFMLRNTTPTTVYIELGNIQNKSNQYRFIEKDNRQAIAKWLCLGFLRYFKK